MDAESEWISPSQRDRTPPPPEYTWDGPHMEEVAPAHLDDHHVTTIVVMTAVTTATTTGVTTVAMIAMTTGTLTDLTDGDLHPHTTEGAEPIDPGPDHAPILHVVIEHLMSSLMI